MAVNRVVTTLSYGGGCPDARIDPLRGRLGRRDLLKMTGAAAGVAALGDFTGGGVLPGGPRSARQGAANAIIFSVGTDIDELDPRTTDTQEGYTVAANVYDCLVLYDLGATTIRPGLAESWEISEDGLVYLLDVYIYSFSILRRTWAGSFAWSHLATYKTIDIATLPALTTFEECLGMYLHLKVSGPSAVAREYLLADQKPRITNLELKNHLVVCSKKRFG